MVTPRLRAGIARADITPREPLLQGGFGQRTTPAVAVRDPLAAKALFVSQGSAANTLLWITTDLLCIPKFIGAQVIERLARATGVPAEAICVCASHTHSGPSLVPAATDSAAGRYAAELIDTLVAIGERAVAGAAPAHLGSGCGRVDVLLNRRTRGAPNRVDPRVPVVRIDSDDGVVLAILFGVGCHPVTLGWDNPRTSADFPGVAQQRIEAEFVGAQAMFFNGTEGNVVPITSPNRDALDPRGYCGGSDADTAHIGATLAAEVLRVARAIAPELAPRVGGRRFDLRLPPRASAFERAAGEQRLAAAEAHLVEVLGADWEARADGFLWSLASRWVVEQDCDEPTMRRLMVACCDRLGLAPLLSSRGVPAGVAVPVQVLVLGRAEFLALPGEVLVEVGEAWRELAGHDAAYIVGLANAHLRYLPSDAHFAEADAEQHYETITAGLAPGGMTQMLTRSAELLTALRSATLLA